MDWYLPLIVLCAKSRAADIIEVAMPSPAVLVLSTVREEIAGTMSLTDEVDDVFGLLAISERQHLPNSRRAHPVIVREVKMVFARVVQLDVSV